MDNIQKAIAFNKNIKLKLTLFGMKNLTDVSMLGRVHTLNLKYCINLSDVSMLGNVYDLNLSECYSVSNVSMLGRVHTLNLSHCDKIKDVSKLGGVHTLILKYCDGIKDVSMLGNVHTLNLSGYKHIKNYFSFLLSFSLLPSSRNYNLKKEDNAHVAFVCMLCLCDCSLK